MDGSGRCITNGAAYATPAAAAPYRAISMDITFAPSGPPKLRVVFTAMFEASLFEASLFEASLAIDCDENPTTAARPTAARVRMVLRNMVSPGGWKVKLHVHGNPTLPAGSWESPGKVPGKFR